MPPTNLLGTYRRWKATKNPGTNKMFRNCRNPDGVTWLAILSVCVTLTATALAVICIIAGSTPHRFDQYAIFTLNTSRIGQNLRQDLDRDIMAIHLKRSMNLLAVPNDAVVSTPTVTTLITMAPRAPDNIFGGVESTLKNGLTHAGGDLSSDASHVKSDAHSAATAAETAIHSAASAAVGAVQSEAVKLVNEGIDGLISDFNLSNFYAVHLLTTCSGHYDSAGGQPINVTDYPTNKTSEHVDTCKGHSAVDPISWMHGVYAAGAAIAAVETLLALASIWKQKPRWALANIAMAGLAFCVLGAASALTQGISVGAVKLTNAIGQYIGVAATIGTQFFRLSWAATALCLLQVFIWVVLYWRRRRLYKYGGGDMPMQHRGGGYP